MCSRLLKELCKRASRLGSTQASLFQQIEKQTSCHIATQGVIFCQIWGNLKAAEAEATTDDTVFLCVSSSLFESASCLPMEAVMFPMPDIPSLPSRVEMNQDEG